MIRTKSIMKMLVAFGLCVVGAVSGAHAQSAGGFRQYQSVLRAESLNAGVSAATLDRVLPTLEFLPSVIRLDRSQPGDSILKKSIPAYSPYRRKHLTSSRIRLGKAKFTQVQPLLQRIEAEYGVPGKYIIAIYGKETGYGSFSGRTDVPSALATLAYEGRRRDFFTAEFVATMQMIDQGVPRGKLKGSWAGAMGYPQFMPTVYHELAIDGDGDGLADIWANETDALTSIANYFVERGWRRGVKWGYAVDVPSSLNRTAIESKIKPERCERVFERHSEWKSIAEWEALGLTPQSGMWPADRTVMATLLEPDGQGSTAYLLTSNYRVILDYNCSNFYALTVGLLADSIDY